MVIQGKGFYLFWGENYSFLSANFQAFTSNASRALWSGRCTNSSKLIRKQLCMEEPDISPTAKMSQKSYTPLWLSAEGCGGNSIQTSLMATCLEAKNQNELSPFSFFSAAAWERSTELIPEGAISYVAWSKR